MRRYPFTFVLVTVALSSPLLACRCRSPKNSLSAGDRLAAEGKLAEAIESYARVIEQRPDNADAHARLGGMYLMQQQYSDAVKSFQRAISLDGEQARAFVGMGMAYLHLGRHELARAAFNEAKRLKPELSTDIDPVLAWLDSRDGDEEFARH